MKVKLKFLTGDAKVPYKKNKTDFGYDVYATSVEEVAPNVYKYGTGLAFQIDDEEEDCLLSVDGRPRSSVWKTGMVLANSTATIDRDYNGEVQLI